MSAKMSRRASPRVAASIKAEYEQAGKRKGTCRVVELAAGGCILGGTELLPAGSPVSVAMRFDPETPQACVQGSVVHIKRGAGTALEFLSATPEARQMIIEYVEHQLSE